MRILVTGADGFIGRNVSTALASAGDEVFYGARQTPQGVDPDHYRRLDLLDKDAIEAVISDLKPDAIVNCAGVVDPSQNVDNNKVFTQNLMEAAAKSSHKVRRVVICGSAGVYGQVHADELPVTEANPLRANSVYALSKKAEEDIAVILGAKYGIPVTIARIFNPIGGGMGPRYLVSALLNQARQIQAGELTHIEVSRLDSSRDYVAVEDVAQAIKTIIHGNPKDVVYNVGSGHATTNARLIELILDTRNLDSDTPVQQTSPEPEAGVASQADITKMFEHFGWKPQISLETAVKEVGDDTKHG